jgi:tryptophan 2,3-dioxygenase
VSSVTSASCAITPPSTGERVGVDTVFRLVDDLEHTAPETFPYRRVVAEYHRVGKHFVSKELLAALDAVRRRLPEFGESPGEPLAGFLDSALDKYDGRYDYPTYIGLPVLPLPEGEDQEAAAEHRDRLVLLLVTDALWFELLATSGRTRLLPRMRPDERRVAKRCRLGLRSIRSEAERPGPAEAMDPVEAAREITAVVRSETTPDERLMLELTMLPVDIVHDEYLFIRVLQSFEATFALLTVQLSAAVRHLGEGRGHAAAERLAAAEHVLHRAAPLFSLLATMQVASFRLFRQFTEGASAIQSRNYKRFEALCRRPDPERLDSPAYRSVPEVRRRVIDGVSDLDAALRQASLSAAERAHVVEAMNHFAATLVQWRKTHYRLAIRMLGDRPGTGYTEGTPYLREAVGIPVFRETL